MRSEKLNIKKNVISRLEVPMSAVCAAPHRQTLRGWVIDYDGAGARLSLRLKGQEIPHEVIDRPDIEKGYRASAEARIFGFQTEIEIPADEKEMAISLVAEMPDGTEIALFENVFPVRTVDADLSEICREGGILMKPESFVMPTFEDFDGTFVLRPNSLEPVTELTRAAAQFRALILHATNVHELYVAVYEYASKRQGNVGMFQLNLETLLEGYARAFGRWVVAADRAMGGCVVNGRQAVVVAHFLSRLFPRARLVVESNFPVESAWTEDWERTVRRLGDRLKEVESAPDFRPKPEKLPAEILRTDWPVYEEERPIFVLGAGRSGTSVATRILSQGKYPSFNEGHVFPYLERQLQVIRESWPGGGGTVDSLPDGSVFERPLVEMVAASAKKDPAARRWVDKTPDSRMLYALPVVARLYPHAQYIFLRRHPLKLAESRRRKFHEPIETALGEWTRCERLWLEAKPGLPTGSCIECDQSDFSLRTGRTVQALVDFLHPTATQQRNMFRAARSDRPENTLRIGDGIDDRRDFIYRQLLDLVPPSLSEMGWPEAAVDYYLTECRELAEQLGYTTEPSIEQIKADIRDVSAEIHATEELRLQSACGHEGVINSGRHLIKELRTTFKKTINPK